jgi:hypothetical protein
MATIIAAATAYIARQPKLVPTKLASVLKRNSDKYAALTIPTMHDTNMSFSWCRAIE